MKLKVNLARGHTTVALKEGKEGLQQQAAMQTANEMQYLQGDGCQLQPGGSCGIIDIAAQIRLFHKSRVRSL